MKRILCILALSAFVAIVGLAGCSSPTGRQGIGDTNQPATNIPVENRPEAPERAPGGVGITAGQSGTGTTSGASTGY